MLILSRKVKETILIGDEVQITVEEVRGGRVKLGITAPRHVTVTRPEARTKQPRPQGDPR